MDRITEGKITSISGPVVFADLPGARMRDLVKIGVSELIGEIIEIRREQVVIQVFEDTLGLKPGERVFSTRYPLSVELGPGMIGKTFDGIQRPLQVYHEQSAFISPIIGVTALDRAREWEFTPLVDPGTSVRENSIIGTVFETHLITAKILIPNGIIGTIKSIMDKGLYRLEDVVAEVDTGSGVIPVKMYQVWPIRKPRGFIRRLFSNDQLITGTRVLDFLFPLKRGGVAAIPGGFGAGKTMLQHSLAKWISADLIIYVGCGERGNEMTQVLEEFPELIDPRSGRPLIERTILIANTSNMPVTARESSIYTGITIAEYFRDMGYDVAVMADSTSRWAEALREISGRLEEIPAEEGFPSYLASRLAEFYERAGLMEVYPDRFGSITAIGAVSPQGGDFSEPVTQNTKRFIRAFWALDKNLAGGRHFPAISWLDSYSEYVEEVKDWWLTNYDKDWYSYRVRAMEIFQKDQKLQQIVKLVGQDALPDDERLLLLISDLLKVAFLQQNAFDAVDMYCSPDKQIKMFELILFFYTESEKSLQDGVPFQQIQGMEVLGSLKRMKLEYPNDRVSGLDDLLNKMKEDFQNLKEFG